ncbi:MAG: family 78 glycoside hydrolase catalytic domain, partial [Clostridia bacterium]|nr:family 78 glycoside hydrolase catalytic domain [Clostridia bacterium]
KVYINGIFACQGPAAGYIGAYNFCEADITAMLEEGENEIVFHVYYQGLINRVWISGDLRMGLIADVLADDRVIASSDGTWEFSRINSYVGMRVTGANTQFLEDFDSRIPDGEAVMAVERGDLGIVFRDRPAQLAEVYTVRPLYCVDLGNGGLFYDFGHELTGSLRICADGAAGSAVRILCGEETEKSELRTRFRMRCGCEYDEIWTLKDGENMLEQFDYKAFRYVTLVPSGGADVISVEAIVRHGRFPVSACTLDCEDRVLKDVFELCKNGVRFGTQEVYVDCPSREKGQYAGDMTVTSASQLWLTGDPYMLEKGIRDQAESAVINEGLMAVTCCSLMQEIADYSLQFPLLLLRHYAFTGDRNFLAGMLPVVENMIEYFARFSREDGLIENVDKWNLVDWPENLRDGYDFALTKPVGPGAHNVLNAFYVGCVLKIEEIKDLLGIEHGRKGRELSDAFNNAFFDYENGVYRDSEESRHSALHSNILPAFYGLVPEEYENRVADYIESKGMSCGVYMSFFLLKALCRLGRYGAAYRLITSTGENSWYNMVRQGGTTCFEAWGKDKKWNTSLCHPWASAPITVLIEDLLSVSPDGRTGIPHIPENAGKIKMKIPTSRGSVVVEVN